ncbi:MAG: phosphatase PAP2 family protein [Lactobacillales bacterium]|jgi:undecaprenyl-diphosphatase|nr:phosphatase PAP2 family protein [Lactobacillales bacterium]
MKNKIYYQFAASCCLLVFIMLGYTVKFYPLVLKGFDDFFTDVFRTSLYPQATPFFVNFTKIGNPEILIPLLVITFILFVLLKRYAEALWLAAGMGGIVGILNPLLKLLFHRERPTIAPLVIEKSFSFPSGHAVSTMIFFGTLLFLTRNFIKQHSFSLAVQILLSLLIIVIAISRVYCGVHFPSDVLAGDLLGLGWLTFTYPIFEKQRFIWRFKGKQK